MNSFTVNGRLGQDPESKTTKNGNPMCRFSIADNRSWTDGQGKRQTETHWLPVLVFGSQAESCAEYLRKGSHVLIKAKVNDRRWTDDTGEEQRQLQIVADRVEFLDSAPSDDSGFDVPTAQMSSATPTDDPAPF